MNSVAIAKLKANPKKLATLKDLTNHDVRIVLGVKNAPFGYYAELVLAKIQAEWPEFRKKINPNIVSYDFNVQSAITKLNLGLVDIGFIYKSDLKKRPQLSQIDLDLKYQIKIEYGFAIFENNKKTAIAEKLLQFIKSAEGKALILEYGFDAI